MDDTELAFASIEQLSQWLRAKKVSPVELVEMLLSRIESLNPQLNSYLTVTAEQALAEARIAEREILRGHYRGPMHGVPISLKDNIGTRRVRTTAGSKILGEFVPEEDASVVERLRRVGAIVMGKTNLHEFAYGVTTVNPHFGATRNPWSPDRIAGGSSGGSAVAVVAGLCFASLGTDTGGSIRIPAAMCGVAGLKPTFGLVSCHGIVPLAPSLDHAGPLARTVSDIALLLRAMARSEPRDWKTALRPAEDDLHRARRPLGRRGSRSTGQKARVRLGWPREYFWDKLDDELRQIVESAARSLEREGFPIEEVSLPHVYESVEPSTHIALAEARHFHETSGYFPARAGDYGEDVRRLLEKGAEIRATDYLRAFEVRKQVRADFETAFAHVEAIVVPTVPVPAPGIGEQRLAIGGAEEPVRSALLRLNRPANFTGLPAISIPCGFTKAGLPAGLQLIGRAFDEATLLRIAHTYEQAHDWHTARPPGV